MGRVYGARVLALRGPSKDESRPRPALERHPLYVPDMLIEERGLRPRTELRLAAVAHDAVDALIEAAQETDTAIYLERKRELTEAIVAVHHLRFLRQGSGALGFQNLNPEPAPRPRW